MHSKKVMMVSCLLKRRTDVWNKNAVSLKKTVKKLFFESLINLSKVKVLSILTYAA